MLTRWLLASLHLLALGIGLGAIVVRARALRRAAEPAALARAFAADTAWGAAGFLWIATGLIRLFGGMEKAPAYYWQSHAFWTKMALLALLLVLEVWAGMTLTRWRFAVRQGRPIDTGAAPALARASFIQAGLVVLMILAATAMARGLGATVGVTD